VNDSPAHRPNRLLGALAIRATLVLPAGLVALPACGSVAVIGSPGQDVAAIVASAGGTILRPGGGPHVLAVRAGSSDLVARLDARFATGCTPTAQT
jgi:hypothetical protein